MDSSQVTIKTNLLAELNDGDASTARMDCFQDKV